MKSLYNNRRHRRGDGEKHSFAFFAVGAIVILSVVFVIGLQVGRVVEKNAAISSVRDGKGTGILQSGPGAATRNPATDVRKDLGSFSEEAGKVPGVPPPDAKETAGDVEKKLTFQETLPRKEAAPVAFVHTPGIDNAATVKGSGEGRKNTFVQAATFRDKGKAELFRKRLADGGYAARMVRGTGKNREKYYRVLVGPFPDHLSARKAVERLKKEMRVEAYLLPG